MSVETLTTIMRVPPCNAPRCKKIELDFACTGK